MTEYVRVDLSHVSRGEWVGYIPEYDMFVYGSSQAIVEHESFRVLEEAFGLRAFSIIFREV